MSTITLEEALNLKDAVLIDVRSELEFLEDHIPGAINMPILDNEERHIVGCIYKQESTDKAYEVGWKVFDKKIKAFEELVENFKKNKKKIVFYCFRGGFRSGCLHDYFEKQIEFKDKELIFKIEGGYKRFREYVREEIAKIDLLNQSKKIVVIYGLTGSAKTEIIRRLDSAIDLEGAAMHRSSTFGAVGLTPRSQKLFETDLLFQLKKQLAKSNKESNVIIFEGESRKIGDAEIPKNIFLAMNDKSTVLIDTKCDISIRAQRIVQEYFANKEQIEQLRALVPKLIGKIGKKNVEMYVKFIDEKKYFEFAKTMLGEYYDPLYLHFTKNMKFSHEVRSENIVDAVKKIKEICKKI